MKVQRDKQDTPQELYVQTCLAAGPRRSQPTQYLPGMLTLLGLPCFVLFCRLFLIWVFFLFSEEMSFFSRFSSVLCLNCQEAARCSPGLILVECNITRDNHWLQCDEKVLPSLSRACAHQ